MRGIRRRWMFGAAALLGCARAAEAQAPRLDGGAAWLGGTLELELFDLAPHGAFDVWFSREPGEWHLPQGVLELRRDRARHVAAGTADAAGHARLALPLTSDPAVVEAPLRFQAVVDAPGGRAVTNLVATRLTGPRVYAGFHRPATSGIHVVDPLRSGIVTTIDFGMPSEAGETRDEGKPVFDRGLRSGAACAGRRDVVRFDPHFGTIRGVLAFPTDVSRTLRVDAAATTFFVLETGRDATASGPATLHAFAFDTGTELAALVLPGATTDTWCTNRDGSLAALAESDAAGHTRVRFVDLVHLTDLGTRDAGSPANTRFDALAWGWGDVWVATSNALGPGALEGTLSRLPPPGSSSPVQIGAAGGVPLISDLLPVPAAGSVLGARFFYSVPATQLFEAPLLGPTVETLVAGPGPYLHVDDAAVDGTRVWFLDRAGNEPPGGSEPGRVHGLDVADHSWTTYPRTWPFAGPAALEVLHDPFVDCVVVANVPLPPPISIPAELLFASPAAGSELHVPLPDACTFVAAVPVPR